MFKKSFVLQFYSPNKSVQPKADIYVFEGDIDLSAIPEKTRERAAIPESVERVVVMSNNAHYQGISVTNACEHIASFLLRDHKIKPEGTLYVEHYASYPETRYRNPLFEKPSFDLVRFEWREGRLKIGPRFPDWEHTLRAYDPEWASLGKGAEGKAIMAALTGAEWIYN